MLRYPKTGITQCILGTKRIDVTGSQTIRKRRNSDTVRLGLKDLLMQGFIELVQSLHFILRTPRGGTGRDFHFKNVSVAAG